MFSFFVFFLVSLKWYLTDLEVSSSGCFDVRKSVRFFQLFIRAHLTLAHFFYSLNNDSIIILLVALESVRQGHESLRHIPGQIERYRLKVNYTVNFLFHFWVFFTCVKLASKSKHKYLAFQTNAMLPPRSNSNKEKRNCLMFCDLRQPGQNWQLLILKIKIRKLGKQGVTFDRVRNIFSII